MERFDPSRGAFSPYGLTCVRWSTEGMTRTDRHNEIELNYIPRGKLTYVHGGKKLHLVGGNLAVFWAALPHQVVASSGLENYYVATIPLVQFLELELPLPLTQALLRGEFLCEHLPVHAGANPSTGRAHENARFENWCADFASRQAARMRAAQLEIHARLERFALACAATHYEKSKADRLVKGELSKAEQMAAFIATQYAAPLSVVDVSRAVDLHPNYAMAVFAKTFGLSITEFIRQHRLAQAQAMLVTTDLAILQIGLAAGFQSVSQFYAVFKHYCHCSPRQYRSQHRV